MRLATALVLLTLAAPARAQGVCSDGTSGVRLSLSEAEIVGDQFRVCFAVQGDPAEAVGSVQYRISYDTAGLGLAESGVGPGSPYEAGGYEASVVHCLLSPDCDDNGYASLHAPLGGPYVSFSAAPVEAVCHTFAVFDPSQTAGIRVDQLQAERGDGTAVPVCPAADLPGYDGALPAEDGPSGTFALAVRPNPVRGAGEVRLSLGAAGPARVAVVDALGREVAVVLDGPVAAGERAVPVNTSGWPAGVYVVRATAAGRAASARLVVAR